jgi:hypothetical protein
MAAIKLEGVQKERATRLEIQLLSASNRLDVNAAKTIVKDLEDIYTRFRQHNLLGIAKNKLYEIALDAGDFKFAEEGLLMARLEFTKNTRMWLEATSLLAICYLRINNFQTAQRLISEVLTNKQAIKSEAKRRKFRQAAIERFKEEAVLFAIKGNSVKDQIDQSQLIKLAQKEALRPVSEIFISLGNSVPPQAKSILQQVDSYSKNQLPSAEKLLLPPPKDEIKHEKIGKTVFSSIKRVAYRALCDPESPTYKLLFTKTYDAIFHPVALGAAIASAFSGFGIISKAFLVPVIALIIKFGLEVYCDNYKPHDLMDLR